MPFKALMTQGELCALRWSDVDFTTKTLTIVQSVYRTAHGEWALKDPKTHQQRHISLDPITIEALRRHRAEAEALADHLELNPPDDTVGRSTSSGPITVTSPGDRGDPSGMARTNRKISRHLMELWLVVFEAWIDFC
jgi:integrase